MTGFVDTHSHMVPSGDDGVESVEEAIGLVAEAGRRGTAVQYATPHAMNRHPVTEERRRRVLAARDRIRERLDGSVDFRLGWEVTPEPWLLEADPRDLSMEGLRACLMELPLNRPRTFDLVIACADHIEQAGLTPILAHPERCALVIDEPGWVTRFRRRGWLIQVNASSLSGRHGTPSRDLGWALIEAGSADLVGSDGHRANRPPYLDAAFGAVSDRIGRERALPLFTGAALEQLAFDRTWSPPAAG
jgi:protein-tyrosine phosphatase